MFSHISNKNLYKVGVLLPKEHAELSHQVGLSLETCVDLKMVLIVLGKKGNNLRGFCNKSVWFVNFDDMEIIMIMKFYKVHELVGCTRNKLFHKILGLHKFWTVYLKISLEDICQIVDHQFVTCNYKDLLCTWDQCVQTKFWTKINLVSISQV